MLLTAWVTTQHLVAPNSHRRICRYSRQQQHQFTINRHSPGAAYKQTHAKKEQEPFHPCNPHIFIFKKYFVFQSIWTKKIHFVPRIIFSNADIWSLKAFSPALVIE